MDHYWLKIAYFNLSHLYLAPPFGVIPVEFHKGLASESWDPWAIMGVVPVILRLAVGTIQACYMQTDGQAHSSPQHIPR